jgi:UDP-glucose/galactose:(glucosyl)LPS alpha-1,2-glucosyl/galactosyltransferase
MLAAGCRDIIDIVTACDDGYAQHAHVLVESMLSTNADCNFRVYVLVPPGFRHADRLNKLEEHVNCEIKLVEIDPALVGNLRVSEHITSAAYFRLLIGDVLPARLKRVLYFDSDIVVAGDVLPLWQMDLDDHIIGAVADATPEEESERVRRIVLTGGKSYFNSGVMLVDLVRWRAEDIARKALAFCRDNPDRLRYWDQCALNYVLAGDVLSLDVVWNMQNWHVGKAAAEKDSESVFESVRVVHFTALKPWFYACRHPFAEMYWKFLKQTPWCDYVPPDRTFYNVAKRQLRSLLPDWLVRAARYDLSTLQLPNQMPALQKKA